MKQSLHLNLSQSLAMTPQLQQAIRLLQLSTLELTSEIQEALESNPMLELNEADTDEQPESSANELNANDLNGSHELGKNGSEDGAQTEGLNSSDSADTGPDASERCAADSMPDDLPVDTLWEDVYQNTSLPSPGPSDSEERDFELRPQRGESIQESLSWQLSLTPFSDSDRLIGETIIESINDAGYLTAGNEDILNYVHREYPEVEDDEVEAVLHRIQQFDPPGVACRNLQECLQLQLANCPADTPWLETTKKLVGKFIDKLGARDYKSLVRLLRISEQDLTQCIKLIRTLDPRPASRMGPQTAEYIVPDVFVKKNNGRWTVELNADNTPKLRINANYASLVRRADNSRNNTFLKDNLQEARWFLKSLQSRNQTLLKVSTRIVECQKGFLEYGPEAMKPLILADIADAVGMHESTISRVTNQKYMHTPGGVFELKHFFSSHVGTTTGGECSSTAIRALIKKLIDAERCNKPLSDSKIVDILIEQGIKVARRTIAKYREAMMIPPSYERKSLL